MIKFIIGLLMAVVAVMIVDYISPIFWVALAGFGGNFMARGIKHE